MNDGKGSMVLYRTELQSQHAVWGDHSTDGPTRIRHSRARESRSPNVSSAAPPPAGSGACRTFVTNQLSISARLRSISRGSDADRRDGNRPTRRSSAQVGRFDSLPRGDAIAYGDRFFLEPPATSFLCSYLPTWLLAVSIHRRRVETRPALNRAIELALDWRRPVGQRSASGR